MRSADVVVLGGLTLTAEFTLGPRHVPEDIVLVDRGGRRADWAERKMSDDDWLDVQEQCEIAVFEWLDDRGP